MPSEPKRRISDEGFTLIEVLVAMLILAVGLLGLEALAIGAARSVTRSEQQGEVTVAASRAMEERIQEIRRTAPAVDNHLRCSSDPLSRSYVCSVVLTQVDLATLPAKTARISVTVRRSPSEPVQLTLTSHVLDSRLPPSP